MVYVKFDLHSLRSPNSTGNPYLSTRYRDVILRIGSVLNLLNLQENV